jgi:P27 family predicted phage terminase small subunit
MAGRGPAPTPTAILKLRGSKRARARQAEPQPPAGAPAKPTTLSAGESAAWDRLVAETLALKVLTAPDRGMLQLAAEVESQVADLSRYRREHGNTVIKRDDRGVVIAVSSAPWVRQEHALRAQLKGLYEQLGLSPAARTRVRVEAVPDAAETDPLSALMAKRVPLRAVK